MTPRRKRVTVLDRMPRIVRVSERERAAIVAALGLLLLAALALTGCDIASTGPLSVSPVSAPATQAPSASQPATMPASASWSATSSAQTTACPACPNTGTVQVEGTVEMVDGVQVLRIVAQGETYTPNLFNVKAGVPVRVTFTGKAAGCFKQPTFKSLGKKLDISSGSGSIDLGPLEPGSYGWASALGVCPGTIVAK
jgi:hypothetical protein